MPLISKRCAASQSMHDQMVRTRAYDLRAQGYAVSADLPGFQMPPAVLGRRPDILAVNGTSAIIVEAKTADTLCSDHTREQFRSFSARPGTEFHVVVPRSCLFDALIWASAWNVRVDEWWTHQGY
ncbi:MAG TPA: hypothetical protein VN260_09840 [Dissulfurispiraceae bacterium]|nr:hypothetical protein [Dissulfurispiraceae bacterium]